MDSNTYSGRRPTDHPISPAGPLADHWTGHPSRPATGHPVEPSAGRDDGLAVLAAAQPGDALAALATAVDQLAAQDLDGLSEAVRAERVLVLRRLVDRLEGHWLRELASVDARGAAGAEVGIQAPPPPAGSGPACGWAPVPPTARSVSLGLCSAAP